MGDDLPDCGLRECDQVVTPAQAGVQGGGGVTLGFWIPAYAGMTDIVQ